MKVFTISHGSNRNFSKEVLDGMLKLAGFDLSEPYRSRIQYYQDDEEDDGRSTNQTQPEESILRS